MNEAARAGGAHVNKQLLAAIGAVALGVAIFRLGPVVAAGQDQDAAEKAPTAKAAKTATASAKPYKTPHTAWGDPDLQGTWSHFDPTPLEGPNPDPADAKRRLDARNRRYGAEGKGDGPGGGMSHETDRPNSPRRKALVIDPPDNRIPVKPEANEIPDFDRKGDSWVFHEPGERCITRGVPQGFFTGLGYGRAFEIMQTPGYVVMYPEMIHDTRIIPVDGRPHVGKNVHLWNGDPVGHWEGDTLVVDTTNYNNESKVIGDIAQTETLHVVERFTRVDAKTIDHKITFEDPAVFTRPWTVELPQNLDPTYVIYEYSCHEGNKEYMLGSMKQGRDRDAEAAAKKTKQ
jgi:hypothetical protein